MADSNGPRLRVSREMQLLIGSPLQQAAPGRRCAASDCASLLSRYNPSAVCGVHSGWQDVVVPRRRRAAKGDTDAL